MIGQIVAFVCWFGLGFVANVVLVLHRQQTLAKRFNEMLARWNGLPATMENVMECHQESVVFMKEVLTVFPHSHIKNDN